MFKKDDKVKVIKGIKTFEGLTGTVLATNDKQVKVRLNMSEDTSLQKNLINIFEADQLELESLDLLTEDTPTFDNDVEIEDKEEICKDCGKPLSECDCHKEESKYPKLTVEELKAWCSDNDANYYTQDIKDDKVIIKGLNEDLAEYNFETKELKVFDYSGTTSEKQEDEDDYDDNYIRDYVYDIDMEDEKTEIPSWEFASIIATAEDVTEDDVITEAHDRGYKVFLIQAANYEKVAIASEKITEQDIFDDFASYLEGNAKVTELI